MALKNYKLAQSSETPQPFYPLHGVLVTGTRIILYYCAFHESYLRVVLCGGIPDNPEKVLRFEFLNLGLVQDSLVPLEIGGLYTQRLKCVEVFLRLKALTRCWGGYEENVVL